MMALGTMSIIVRRVMLKYELMSSSEIFVSAGQCLAYYVLTYDLNFVCLLFGQRPRGL